MILWRRRRARERATFALLKVIFQLSYNYYEIFCLKSPLLFLAPFANLITASRITYFARVILLVERRERSVRRD